jgi:hypothetical protein
LIGNTTLDEINDFKHPWLDFDRYVPDMCSKKMHEITQNLRCYSWRDFKKAYNFQIIRKSVVKENANWSETFACTLESLGFKFLYSVDPSSTIWALPDKTSTNHIICHSILRWYAGRTKQTIYLFEKPCILVWRRQKSGVVDMYLLSGSKVRDYNE